MLVENIDDISLEAFERRFSNLLDMLRPIVEPAPRYPSERYFTLL